MNLQQEKPAIRILIWALLFVPVLTLFWLLIERYPGIPKLDDFEAIFQFLSSYLQAEGISDHFQILISQNMEHRIFSVHLFTLIQFYLVGYIRLIDFVVVGNLLWLGTVLLFFYRAHKLRDSWLLAPALFLILQPQVQENSWWAMAALSNYSSLFFLALALWFLTREKPSLNFYVAILCAALSGFCNGGGLVVWPTGVLVLLYTKEYRKSLYWILASAFILGIYFYGYHSVGSSSNNGLNQPFEMFLLLIRVLGSFSEIPPGMKIPSLIPGILMLGSYGYLMFSGYLKRNNLLPAMLTALLMILGMLVLSRFSASGLSVVPSRYKTFSLLFLALLYIAFLERFPPKKITYLICLAAAVGFWTLCSLIYYPKVFYQNRCAKQYAFNFIQTGKGMDYVKGDSILDTFIQKGWYSFPEKVRNHAFKKFSGLVNARLELDSFTNRTVFVTDTISRYTTLFGNFPQNPKVYLTIQSRFILLDKPGAMRLLEVNDARLRSWKDLVGLGKIPSDTFSLVMPSHIPDTGYYKVRFLTRYRDGTTVVVMGENQIIFH